VKKIGILTGGGDAPGLNGVIRGAVLSALRRGSEIVGVRNGFEGFAMPDGIVPLDSRSVRGILWRGGSILGCNNLFRGEMPMYLERLEREGIEGMIIAGGDGTLGMANELHQAGVRVMGVPKTIDNDVRGTSVTFGFHTAVDCVAEACSRLVDTAESHHRVMIVEVMGRHAGHIALHGGMASSADVILLPEIDFEIAEVAKVVRERAERGRTYTMVVVAEGASPRGGEAVVDEHRTKHAGREILGGVGERLAARLRELVDHDVRSITLGHLQRGGTPVAFDRTLGTRMGVAAAIALLGGVSGECIVYWNGEVTAVPLRAVAGGTRNVDPNGDMVVAARNVGISFGDAS
jgi:6-phosphofructokinase 1